MTVNHSESLGPREELTVAAWIRAIDWKGNRRILQKGLNDNQYRLTAEDGKLLFDVVTESREPGGGRLVASAPLPPVGEWVHLAGTYDGVRLRLLVNGAEVASAPAAAGRIAATRDPLVIGCKRSPETIATNCFNGLIDEVVVYDRALTDEELRRLARPGPPRPSSDISPAVFPAAPRPRGYPAGSPGVAMTLTTARRRFDTFAIGLLAAGTVASVAAVPRAAWSQTGAVATQAMYGFLVSLTAIIWLRATGRPRVERIWLTALLAVMPLPYLRSVPPGGALWTELVGLVLFSGTALASRLAPWLLAVGLVGHGLWDLFHLRSGPVPGWYALACAIVDFSLAVYVASRLPAWKY